jgi:uncharacterized protein
MVHVGVRHCYLFICLIFTGSSLNPMDQRSGQHRLNEKMFSLLLGSLPLRSCRVLALERLIKRGADPNALYSDQLTPLFIATMKEQVSVVLVLLMRHADVNTATPTHRATPLHAAVARKNPQLVRLLLSWGAHPTVFDHRLRTPLHLAAGTGMLTLIQTLIARGADINARDERLRTPLHWAVLAGHSDTVRYLLERGAELDTLDAASPIPMAPWDYACHTENNAIKNILLGEALDQRLRGVYRSSTLGFAHPYKLE